MIDVSGRQYLDVHTSIRAAWTGESLPDVAQTAILMISANVNYIEGPDAPRAMNPRAFP